MFKLFTLKHYFSMMVATSCLVMTAAKADAIDDTRNKVYGGLLNLGKRVQLGRECGIPDSEMLGHQADYRAYLTVVKTAQSSRGLSTAQKVRIGTVTAAQAQFIEGTTTVVNAKSRITSHHCQEVRRHWKSEDTQMATHAETNMRIVSKIKKLEQTNISAKN